MMTVIMVMIIIMMIMMMVVTMMMMMMINRKLISEVETIGSEWPLLPTDPLYGSMCTALSSSDDHHRCI